MDAESSVTGAGVRWPDFLVIGAARSGTTALCDALAQHPDVFLCEPKEPHFFAMADRAPDFRGPGDEAMVNRRAFSNPDDYLGLFRSCTNGQVAGEGSVSSLYYPQAAHRIRRHIPDARLICILRDPAERAWSAFQFMRARCYEPLKDFRAALKHEPRRIRDRWHHIWHYREMGFYHRQLSVYFELFDPERICVLLFGDFRSAPAGAVARCYRHIGVDETFHPSNHVSHVASGEPKSRRLGKLLNRPSLLKDAVRPVVPRRLRQALWSRLVRSNLRKSRCPADVREDLVNSYRSDILRLQELLDRDLSHWLTC
jgi:hypothetical protein